MSTNQHIIKLLDKKYQHQSSRLCKLNLLRDIQPRKIMNVQESSSWQMFLNYEMKGRIALFHAKKMIVHPNYQLHWNEINKYKVNLPLC